MAVVGPVTERWAPEQAGPVHENWQLAAPIGPATDLWALGALLFRAVQGHAPYPEESTAELVQMVCAEPPAFAEECGPLRPVVESLLRQDPTERLDFEELRGWLRSLVRSAPEPEAGAHVVAAPPAGREPAADRAAPGRAGAQTPGRAARDQPHGRHKRAREEPPQPRKLGRNLLLLILLALAAAIAYAMVFMPKAAPSSEGGDTSSRYGPCRAAEFGAGGEQRAPARPELHSPDGGEEGQSGASPSESSGATQPQTGDSDVAQGFTLRKDPEGFQVAVASGWDRAAKNGRGQIVYSQGDFELIVVPGRDTHGDVRQRSDGVPAGGRARVAAVPRLLLGHVHRDAVDRGGRADLGRGAVHLAGLRGARACTYATSSILLDGRYHVVQLRGPEAERDEVTRLYEQASATYKATG